MEQATRRGAGEAKKAVTLLKMLLEEGEAMSRGRWCWEGEVEA